MLDSLWRAENGTCEPPSPSTAASPASVTTDDEPMLVSTEEIPFIEVGPKKSMEASPSVLACSPSRLSLVKGLSPSPVGEPVHGIPAPRSVHFRAVSTISAHRSRLAPELLAYHAPNEPAARQYAEVFAAVLNACPAPDRPNVLLCCSALPRCGNTTTLLNLSILAARQERRVLVVDANLREPGIAERLGLPIAPGLREALAGAVSLDEVIQPTELPNLFALTAGVRDTATVRFVSGTIRSLLRQLRQRYPLVFVDGPCWDGRPEVVSLGAACDAVFLVVPETQAESPRTDGLLQLIPGQGVRLAGCILVADTSLPR
jgi:Mrp family chromosome partitioning ATPase